MKLLILATVLALAAADVSHLVKGKEAGAEILAQELDFGLEGEYQWGFKTNNGISAQESGTLKKIDNEVSAQVAQGQASWQAPGGEEVSFQYVADENGYQPQGSHLPTPPPIPEAILRSLEYIRAHPPKPEN